ncbi:hypothetical protein WDU94_011134 [Cyamophila willieti]
MGGCSEMANNMYLSRHNQVAKVVHQNLAIEHKLTTNTTTFYKYSPDQVMENIILYWDQPILTDRSITCNRPDLILVDKKKQSAIIIDIAVPLTHNIVKTENEKMKKYEELKNEIMKIWKLKSVSIIPICPQKESVHIMSTVSIDIELNATRMKWIFSSVHIMPIDKVDIVWTLVDVVDRLMFCVNCVDRQRSIDTVDVLWTDLSDDMMSSRMNKIL